MSLGCKEHPCLQLLVVTIPTRNTKRKSCHNHNHWLGVYTNTSIILNVFAKYVNRVWPISIKLKITAVCRSRAILVSLGLQKCRSKAILVPPGLQKCCSRAILVQSCLPNAAPGPYWRHQICQNIIPGPTWRHQACQNAVPSPTWSHRTA